MNSYQPKRMCENRAGMAKPGMILPISLVKDSSESVIQMTARGHAHADEGGPAAGFFGNDAQQEEPQHAAGDDARERDEDLC
jgi:hypothetical protein